MKPFIHTVTITGLDVNTDLHRLNYLQEQYPFVEWGVLLSETKTGTHPRYPHFNWIQLLTDQGFRLAGHLCGVWARDLVQGGRIAAPEMRGLLSLFSRFQLNISNLLTSVDPNKLMDGIDTLSAPAIVQVGKSGFGRLQECLSELRVRGQQFLFDASGGRGVETPVWPKSFGLNCGYAGGLRPENLRENIYRIFDAAEDQTVWIDVESGVRDELDFLDLKKVEQFLDIAQAYVVSK